jgi:hypothetical protein
MVLDIVVLKMQIPDGDNERFAVIHMIGNVGMLSVSPNLSENLKAVIMPFKYKPTHEQMPKFLFKCKHGICPWLVVHNVILLQGAQNRSWSSM